jgi:hypothetical protein
MPADTGMAFCWCSTSIPITKAIAVWKKELDAQFQLIRKNPIQGQISYVLGRRV